MAIPGATPITFTLDLEDHRADRAGAPRYGAITDEILAFLQARDIAATVFVVGTLAEADPGLIRRIHDLGHEIAHHSLDHITLDRQTPEQFRADTRRARDILEDITGEKVRGYRAPVFSLTRRTVWAVDILADLGFDYSSSVLPAASPLHGFPGLPTTPFRWSGGLLEIPAPVADFGPLRLPYLGGVYLRYLPLALIRRAIDRSAPDAALWTYCHPYDFDPDERDWRIRGASLPVSLLLWFNRGNTFARLERLAALATFAPPFRARDFGDGLASVDIARFRESA